MKLNKIFAAVAATAVAASMAVSASAYDVATMDAPMDGAELKIVGAETHETGAWADYAWFDFTEEQLSVEKDIVIFVEPVEGAEKSYFKVAGNDMAGAWVDGYEGDLTVGKEATDSKIYPLYDAEAGTITLTTDEWWNFTQMAVQGEGFTVYGIAWADDTATIDEIKALMGGETEAPETEAPETEAPETEAPETEAPETEAPETEAPEADNGGSANTGLVTVSLAGLAVAGAAVVATKKRK